MTATVRIKVLGVSAAFCAACVAASGGCKKGESAQWLLNGLIDPTQTGQFLEPKRNEIRGSLSILEEPVGIQEAEEPQPEDLAAEYTEHRFVPGDTIAISVFELLIPGQATVQQFTLSNSGYESLPVLGRVKVAGFTPVELELELKEQIRAAGILPDPEVQITLLETRSQRFSIIGSVARAGTYEIPHPDYRLLSAIADAGGIPPQIRTIYVFRRGAVPGASGVPTTVPTEDSVVRRFGGRRSGTLTMSETSSGPASTSRAAPPPETMPAVTEPALQILPSTPSTAATRDTESVVDELRILEGAPEPTRQIPVWDAETGSWVIRNVESAPSPATKDGAVSPTRPAGQETADGEGMAGEELATAIRIIEIPTKELLAGDPRYNVVIRPFDLINVPPGPVGEFYVMGNISRPGAYDLTGRRLTVKEAIASSGGFGPLAWPSRADLVRRVSQDEEQIIQLDLDAIFAGTAPDFYLKPNDIVNVGTTPAAVFLAVLRNAFRFSYGFGFVYDRNFADGDSFQAKEQLKQRRFQEAQAKGLPG
ncbi:MAG TPA: SLBB domain-containing protein [Phycisphaerae bacterium]|nr:SLBB domain-containing protein [Phycisphaerae bacterium]